VTSLYVSDMIYIDISAAGGKSRSESPYTLNISSKEYTPDAEKEPNNSKSTANNLQSRTVTGYCTGDNDKDYYIFAPGRKISPQITVTGIDNAAFTVSVTDPAGYIIRTEKIAGDRPVSFRELIDGKAYFIVEFQKENTVHPYTITVDE
ncbi:MAG: hypothetical protein ACRCUT_10475, partial [Spirochaetota bacterium]